MTLFKPSRWLVLVVALWFGGLYCVLGCEIGVQAVVAPVQASAGHDGHVHGQPRQITAQEVAAEGGQKSESEPADTGDDNEMACCRATPTTALVKSKVPDLQVAESGPASAFPHATIGATLACDKRPVDSSGTSSLHRVLRI